MLRKSIGNTCRKESVAYSINMHLKIIVKTDTCSLCSVLHSGEKTTLSLSSRDLSNGTTWNSALGLAGSVGIALVSLPVNQNEKVLHHRRIAASENIYQVVRSLRTVTTGQHSLQKYMEGLMPFLD